MSLVSEPDYGTPSSKAEKTVTLAIDGRAVTAPEGTSIMRAAIKAGIAVPKLCAYDMVDAFGSCRLCLVEIEGRAGTPASCTTPVAEGLVVTTQSERLARLRRNIMELYVSDHPADVLAGATTGTSEMQEMIKAVGLREVRAGHDGANHLDAETDVSNPYSLSRCARHINSARLSDFCRPHGE